MLCMGLGVDGWGPQKCTIQPFSVEARETPSLGHPDLDRTINHAKLSVCLACSRVFSGVFSM